MISRPGAPENRQAQQVNPGPGPSLHDRARRVSDAGAARTTRRSIRAPDFDPEQEMLSLQFQDAMSAVFGLAADPPIFVKAVVRAANLCTRYISYSESRDLVVSPSIQRKLDAFSSRLRTLLVPGNSPLADLDFEELQDLQECLGDEMFADTGLQEAVCEELESFDDDGLRGITIHPGATSPIDEIPFNEQLAQIQLRMENAVDQLSESPSRPYEFISAAAGALAAYSDGVALCRENDFPVAEDLARERAELGEILAHHLMPGELPLVDLEFSQLKAIGGMAVELGSVRAGIAVMAEYQRLGNDLTTRTNLCRAPLSSFSGARLAQVMSVGRRVGLESDRLGAEICAEVVRRGMEARAPRERQEREDLKAQFEHALAIASNPETTPENFVEAVFEVDRLSYEWEAHCEQVNAPVAVTAELKPLKDLFDSTLQGRLVPGEAPLNNFTYSCLNALYRVLPASVWQALDQESDQLDAAYTRRMDQIARTGMLAMRSEELQQALTLALRREGERMPAPVAIHAHLVAREDEKLMARAVAVAADEAIACAASPGRIVRAMTVVAAEADQYQSLCAEHGFPMRPDLRDKIRRLNSALIQTMVPGTSPLNELELATVPELARALSKFAFHSVKSAVEGEVLRIRTAVRSGLAMLEELGVQGMDLAALRELRDNLKRIEPISPVLRLIRAELDEREEDQETTNA